MPNMQMNFRIDAELKRRGDERFARLGCTPSEALRRFYEMLEQLRRTDDMVILLISHDLGYVRRHADRVLLLDREVKAAGTPEEVFSSPAFREAFPGGGLDGV